MLSHDQILVIRLTWDEMQTFKCVWTVDCTDLFGIKANWF